jgi:alpha-galactosidase
MNLLADFRCGDMAISFLRADSGDHIELQLTPWNLLKLARKTRRRQYLDGEVEIDALPRSWRPIPAYFLDSLVQYKIVGDGYSSGFAGGLTMRDSDSVKGLRFDKQQVDRSSQGLQIITGFKTSRGLYFEHILRWQRKERAVSIATRCKNTGREAVTLEMLASFSLGGLTPFDPADAMGRLILHRYRSYWSAEARLDSQPIEALHLERSWTGHGQFSERFGQVGSMPVRKFFPFAAVEDKTAGVIWASQLNCPGSWQMELSRRGDTLALSGGLADREFGHWTKQIKPGESFETPMAAVTVVRGDLQEACQRLVALQKRPLKRQPKLENQLPIVFNEWCTSWGNPTHDGLIALADRLKGSPVKYLVIDDGWAVRRTEGTQENGDWIVDPKRFPLGLASTCAEIRKRGFIPGIWFEFEVCNLGSKAFEKSRHHLHRDGRVLTVGSRRFWDFRDPWVHKYLYQRVLCLIRDNGFGYLKVDYNDTIGHGCDAEDSLGEGLRQHLEGVQSFFRRLSEELPELVIENCSSGGHRLEPSMQALAAMGSFSDAHETVEVPIIAANLHNLILPRQSQIWAVLRPADSAKRLHYSLAATFLGRMALSGDIHQLNPTQWKIVQEAMRLYRKVYPIIRDGHSRTFGPAQFSFRHPTGWQALRRSTKSEILVIAHNFMNDACRTVTLSLPRGKWNIQAEMGCSKALVQGGELQISFEENLCGKIILLTKQV